MENCNSIGAIYMVQQNIFRCEIMFSTHFIDTDWCIYLRYMIPGVISGEFWVLW